MVFYISVIVILIFVLWGIINPAGLSAIAENLLEVTIEKFGWLYLLSAFLFYAFLFIYLSASMEK